MIIQHNTYVTKMIDADSPAGASGSARVVDSRVDPAASVQPPAVPGPPCDGGIDP